MLNRVGIQSFGGIHLLEELSVALDKSGIESERRSIIPCPILQCIVVVLSFLLGDTLIVITCRGEDKVVTVGLVHALGQIRGVEDNPRQYVGKLFHRLSVGKRQFSAFHLI